MYSYDEQKAMEAVVYDLVSSGKAGMNFYFRLQSKTIVEAKVKEITHDYMTLNNITVHVPTEIRIPTGFAIRLGDIEFTPSSMKKAGRKMK